MSTLNQIRQGLSQAWESVAEGWQELRELAGDAITRFQPRSESGELQTAEEQVVERASRWGLLAGEVTDIDDEVRVRLEAPGLDPQDFRIEVVGDMLVVRGEKKLAREDRQGRFHLMERAYGMFERAIRLPAQVDHESAKADYKRGVLTVTMPKSETARVRRIEIRKG